MDDKTISSLKEIKRRSFFSTVLKGATAFFIINSFPLKFLLTGDKKVGKIIKLEKNPLAVKRNKRG